MGLRLLVGSDLGGLIDTLCFEAYSLYSQGMTYREIGRALGISSRQATYQARKYARITSSPFPLPRRRRNGEYLHALYKNGMSVKDIGKLMSLHKDKVYFRIRRFCEDRGLPEPFKHDQGDFALRLRMTTEMTYDQIAKIAGYSDRISCYRGVQRALKRQTK